jgi:hypothetical protein
MRDAAGHRTHARLPGQTPVSIGQVGCRLLIAGVDQTNARSPRRLEEWIQAMAAQRHYPLDPAFLESFDEVFNRSHLTAT